MEDPARDIDAVVKLVAAAATPDIQKAAILRYFAPDASFRHPLCAVSPAPRSRDAVLRIFQWYRVLSPVLALRVRRVAFHPGGEKTAVGGIGGTDAHPPPQLFLDIVQTFHIRWSPFPAKEARLLTRLTLRPAPSSHGPPRFLIAAQEDFYHPDDFAALLAPPLVPLVRALLLLATCACGVLAWAAALLGECFRWCSRFGAGGMALDTRARSGSGSGSAGVGWPAGQRQARPPPPSSIPPLLGPQPH
ncbi:hypothetical protein AcW1_003268 [Taiwanofungus camphoratus]|nr:hypothetical protein AcW1_003268 [Antrodia cinnamomea]